MQRRRACLERVLVFGLGLFLAVLGLELALRLVGLAGQVGREDPRPSSGACVVLCLGDSYTDNCGVPRDKAYPAQLEQQLNADRPARRFQVLNLGRSGQNSTSLWDALPDNLRRYTPDVVVVLTGSANNFDFTGYQDFEQADSAGARALDWLGRLRVLKMARVVLLGLAEDPAAKAGGQPEARPAAPQPGRVSELARKGFTAVRAGDSPAAERFFRAALAADAKDAEAWHGLAVVCTQTGRYDAGILAGLESLRLDSSPGRYHCVLARLYGLKNEREKALECYLSQLERGSDQGASSWEKRLVIEDLIGFASREELTRNSGRLRALIASRPYLHVYLSEIDPGTPVRYRISDWLAHDLEQVVQACRSENVPVVLMNYPNSRFILDSGPVCEQVARRLSVPFVDNMRSFQGAPVEEFFQPDGHCNEKGNARVAANARTVILEVLGRSRP